jgi:hypothetical protein
LHESRVPIFFSHKATKPPRRVAERVSVSGWRGLSQDASGGEHPASAATRRGRDGAHPSAAADWSARVSPDPFFSQRHEGTKPRSGTRERFGARTKSLRCPLRDLRAAMGRRPGGAACPQDALAEAKPGGFPPRTGRSRVPPQRLRPQARNADAFRYARLERLRPADAFGTTRPTWRAWRITGGAACPQDALAGRLPAPDRTEPGPSAVPGYRLLPPDYRLLLPFRPAQTMRSPSKTRRPLTKVLFTRPRKV